MRGLIRYVVGRTYRPLLVRYLSRTRTFLYKDVVMEIPSEVFHPGFFFSTKILLRYISQMPLKNRSFLELGCGSGLISIMAARRGAQVTASDINSTAVEALLQNAVANNARLHVIHSNLFENIPVQQFDVIAINPPYYKKNPVTEKDHAWFCGEKGEYFRDLFSTISHYINHDSKVLMVLSEVCDLKLIQELAQANRFHLRQVYEERNWMEKNFIYELEQVS
jgi:release factor glutamine methyltransferase